MTEETSPVGALLEDLARNLVEAALLDETPMATKLETFKLLTQWYVGTTRVGAKAAKDDPEAVTMAKMRAELAAAA